MVSSWASLDGLAVLSVSDIVYIVLYTVRYIKNKQKICKNKRQIIDQNPSKLARSRLQGGSRWSSRAQRVRYSVYIYI